MMTNWQGHLEVWHNPNRGECGEMGEMCPQAGMVWTVAGECALADDPRRQWTAYEIDCGDPWATVGGTGSFS